ncbi:hypothetical protein TBR22_A18150 [Luteitalea sp. TBR-22]|nr:hypothetical protein TBR22_A18150 [Luteitalea sp. TBR-22]
MLDGAPVMNDLDRLPLGSDRAMALVHLLHHVAAAANAASSLQDVLACVLPGLCTVTGWDLAHVFLVDVANPTRVASVGAWHVRADCESRIAPFIDHAGQITRVDALGFSRRVVETGEVAWCTGADEPGDGERIRLARACGLSAAAAFPIEVGPEVAAVLECFALEPRPRDDDVADVIAQAGTQLGRVIERERSAAALREVARALQREVAQRREAEEVVRSQVDTMSAVAEALASEPRLDAFLAYLLRAIAQQLQAEGAGIWVTQHDGRHVQPAFSYEGGRVLSAVESLHPAMRGPIDLEDESPIVQAVFRCRRPLVHDVATDPLIRPDDRDYLVAQGVTTVLNLPLFMHDRLVGFLTARRTSTLPFTEEHVRVGQALAAHAALAIELTRLAEDTRATAVVQERSRLARDMHDTLAQAFTGLLAQVEAARRNLDDRADVAERLGRAADMAREGLAEARRAVWALQPHMAPEDLSRRIHAAAARVRDESGLDVVIEERGVPAQLPPDVGQAVLRVIQEALTNVQRHAAARQVVVDVRYGDADVRVCVSDDGAGFDTGAAYQGYGMTSMRERVERLGGAFAVESSPQGTAIDAWLPLPPGGAQA